MCSFKYSLIGLIFFVGQLALAQQSIGVFLIVKNKVSISRGSESIKVNVGQKVQEGDVVITDVDSRAKIVMNDRNIINVSPSTRFKISKYVTDANRSVSLDLSNGKIRNNVIQKYDGEKNKFEVRTATAVAGVRGTRFITGYNPITKVTQVITLKGQVSVLQLMTNNRTNSFNVNRGEKIDIQENTTAEPVKLQDSELKNFEIETDVQKDSSKLPTQGEGGFTDTGASNPIGSELDDDLRKRPNLPNTPTNNIIERRFEKSKIKIITQPPN
jgi:hypothetical protein